MTPHKCQEIVENIEKNLMLQRIKLLPIRYNDLLYSISILIYYTNYYYRHMLNILIGMDQNILDLLHQKRNHKEDNYQAMINPIIDLSIIVELQLRGVSEIWSLNSLL